MAVRKLAPEELQPTHFAFTSENLRRSRDEVVAKYPRGRQASAVIALLCGARRSERRLAPQKAVEAVAAETRHGCHPRGRGRDLLHDVQPRSRRPMFHFSSAARHLARSGRPGEIRKVLKRRIGEERHVTADGTFSWLEVECLGACCNAPMVQINDDYFEDLTPENFEKLLDDLQAGRPVKKGSQIGRNASGPHEAVTTLTDPSLYDGSMIGAWRKRFEEEVVKISGTGEAAAAVASGRAEPRPQSRQPAGLSRPKQPIRQPSARRKEQAADQPGGGEGRGRSVEGDRGRASDRR